MQRSLPAKYSLALAAALIADVACHPGDGAASEAGSTAIGTVEETGEPTTGGPTEDEPDAGLMPLRRLTRVEYDNTVRDLLGDVTHPAQSFPGEGEGSAGFASPGLVGSTDVKRLMEAAEALAAAAVTDLPALIG